MTLSNRECDQAVRALVRWFKSQDIEGVDALEIMGRAIRRFCADNTSDPAQEMAVRRFYASTLIITPPPLKVSRGTKT